jgi:hypothetical protein
MPLNTTYQIRLNAAAGELTHEQRVTLADGLVALYRRKVAEDEQKKAQEAARADRT